MFDPRVTISVGDDGGLSWQTITAIISALVALIATVVGPIVASRIARNQIRSAESLAKSNARLTVRKEWLESITLDLSSFLSIGQQLADVRQVVHRNKGKVTDPEFELMNRLINDLMVTYSRIQIRLDDNIHEHDALLVNMGRTFPMMKFSQEFKVSDVTGHFMKIALEARKLTSVHRREILDKTPT